MTFITDIHHMSAFTKDEKKNFEFYHHVLGLHLVANTVHQENRNVRHLFYGDKAATPGTLFTFFVYPKMGQRYPNDAYFSTVVVKVPENSIDYWTGRLKKNGHEVKQNPDGSITFSDPDTLEIQMAEYPEVIDEDKATTHSDIPRDKQIIKIIDQQIVIPDAEEEINFLNNWLGLNGSPAVNDSESFKLSLKESSSAERSRMGRGTIDHLALGVDTKEDLEKVKNRAEELGLKIDMYKDRVAFSSLYVKDSFGLRFEISTNSPGFDVSGDTHKLKIPKHFETYRDEIKENLGGRFNG